MKIKIKQGFLSSSQEELVEICMQRAKIRARSVEVKGLGRFGKSGAHLLLCQPGSGSPLVIKIHNKLKIRTEYDAMQKVRDYFARDIPLLVKPPYRSGEGGLVYWHQGAVSPEQIKDAQQLDDMVYKCKSGKREFVENDEAILGIFSDIWKRCATARGKKNLRSQDVKLEEEYIHYMRLPRAQEVLSSILNADGHTENNDLFGFPMCNPLWLLERPCFKRLYKVNRGPVHGDLHANNVILDAVDNSVHFIDFAWAEKKKHVLVDYVLMENSLRFLLFPHHVNPSTQLEADKLLLGLDGAQDLAEVRWDCQLGNHYRRLGLILSKIRGEARKYLGGDGFVEYLAAQFLILLGQITYSDYNQLMAVRALGLIATELRTKGFASKALPSAA